MKLYLNNVQKKISIGKKCKTKINALIGLSKEPDSKSEIEYFRAFEMMSNPPDIVTDLSIVGKFGDTPLWKTVINETPFAAATVPIYLAKWYNNKLDPKNLLEIAIEQMEEGVSILTIHPTPTFELLNISSKRIIPFTSRGGGLVIQDLINRNNPSENIYLEILEDLILAAKKTNTVLSIGTTFRPGNIFDSLDDTHMHEISHQIELANLINSKGVGVIIEGPGHCRPKDIKRVSKILSSTKYPIMALGPIPLDSAVGLDHIAGAIGATLLGVNGSAHIISAVTREEHTGGVPNLNSTLEAIECAHVAAKIIDLEILNEDNEELNIARLRATKKSCVANGNTSGCTRCSNICPLIIDFLNSQDTAQKN